LIKLCEECPEYFSRSNGRKLPNIQKDDHDRQQRIERPAARWLQKPGDLIGENGLLKQLIQRLVERVLEVEMTEHLGHSKNASAKKILGLWIAQTEGVKFWLQVWSRN
jgi:hypothetical protein